MTQKSRQQIIEHIKKCRREWDRNGGAQRENTRRCRDFINGDYMDYVDKVQFTTLTGDKKRVTVRINKIEPYVSAVVGFFVQNRTIAKYHARMMTNGVEEQAKIRTIMQSMYSKYSNGLRAYLRSNMNADQAETQQDRDMVGCGLGVVETALTYGQGFASRTKNGEMIMDSHDLDTFWYDTTARKCGLLDARFKAIRKQFNKDEALDLFEDAEAKDFYSNQNDEGSGPDEYQYSDELGSYDRIKWDWASKDDDMVHVDFFQWYEIVPYWRAESPLAKLKNPQAIEAAQMELQLIAQEFAEDEDEKDFNPSDEILAFGPKVKAKLAEAFGEYIEPEEFRRKCYYTAVASGDMLFTTFKSEHQDGYSIKVKTGKFDAKTKIWIGIVNSMMEPQKYYNKALTELMFVIAANAKGGLIIEEDSVEDIEEFEDQFAKTESVCVVRKGAISEGRIKEKRSPHQPTGYEQIIQIADAAIPDSSGIDKNFLGNTEDTEVSGILDRQRVRRIKAILAIYVDSVDLYAKESARLDLDLMRIYAKNNRGELFHILGEDGTKEYMQLADDKLAAEFDIVMDEAPVLPEERQQMAARFTAMGDKLAVAGDLPTAKQLYAFAAKFDTMDVQDLQELRKFLVPEQPAVDPAYVQQLEQLVQQLQSQQVQVQVEKTVAETEKIRTDAAINQEKLPDVRAGVHQKAAVTAKTLEEAQQTEVETAILKKTGGKQQQQGAQK